MIEWTSELSVGISNIDDQHKKLIEIINKLLEINSEKLTDQVISQTDSILSQLLEYTVKHFRDEEEYMRQISHSHLMSHKKFHEQFISRTNAFYAQFLSGEKRMDKEILVFLEKWLVHHIKVEDQKYVRE